MHRPSVLWGGGTAFVIGLSRQLCDDATGNISAESRIVSRSRLANTGRRRGRGWWSNHIPVCRPIGTVGSYRIACHRWRNPTRRRL